VSCRRAVVSGRVQGVGFRYFAERATVKTAESDYGRLKLVLGHLHRAQQILRP